ncbi:MAG: radical SAM protein [Spirochaetia bacterium]
MDERLSWVPEFYWEIAPYIFLRRDDGLLILPPNRVYKMNDSGFQILEYLEKGGKLDAIPGMDDDKSVQLQEFFLGLKTLYQEETLPPGVERVPFDFDFTRLPILGEIAVTYRCNNKCRFCYAGCGDTDSAKMNTKELSFRELKKIIRIFRDKAKIPFFSFTGGEPLVRHDLEKLMKYAVSLGFRINLITNGTLVTEKRANAFYKAGLRTAQVSVEGPEEGIHDELVGVPGAFQRTLRGIKLLQDAGIRVQTNTTITRVNIDSVIKIPSLLAQIGVKRFSMNLFIPTGKSTENEELFISYSEIGRVVDELRKEAHSLGLTFYWYSPTPHCYYNPIARGLGNKSCAAMDGLISVTPTGDVIPCSSYDKPMGNLLTQDFKEVWFSEQAGWFKQKKYAPRECEGCESFTACQAACPLYWQYAGVEEIRKCKRKGA